MLFDLRGRGRRRTIQAIYLTLAILMGGGLVLFGIGGNVSGGLVDAIQSDQGGDGGGLEDEVKAADKRVKRTPRNPAAWAALADARFRVAGQGENYDQAKGTFTDKGRQVLAGARTAWRRHLALAGKKPNANVATVMVQALGPNGLNDLPAAVEAQEIVVDSQEPNSNLYANLAVLAYQAGQTRKGDLAAARAVELAPKDQRSLLKDQLAQAKTSASGAAATTPPAG
jgi:hypothetical protein